MEPRPRPNPIHDKLLVLYLLSGADMWLSELQIVHVMSELGLLNYFSVKAALTDMALTGLAEENIADGSASYHIAPAGRTTVAALHKDIRLSMREAVDLYLERHRSDLQAESRFRAYLLTEGDVIRVHLEIHAGGRPVFELVVDADSRREAQDMMRKWRDNAVAIYQGVLANLC